MKNNWKDFDSFVNDKMAGMACVAGLALAAVVFDSKPPNGFDNLICLLNYSRLLRQLIDLTSATPQMLTLKTIFKSYVLAGR